MRIVPGEPQHRDGDAHLAAVAARFGEVGEDLLGILGLTEADQGVHDPGPHRPGERVRRGQPPRQPLGGPERGQCLRGPPAGQLDLPTRVLDAHRRDRRGLRADRALGALHPRLRLLRRPCQASADPSVM
jgi:hypothetical protein